MRQSFRMAEKQNHQRTRQSSYFFVPSSVKFIIKFHMINYHGIDSHPDLSTKHGCPFQERTNNEARRGSFSSAAADNLLCVRIKT